MNPRIGLTMSLAVRNNTAEPLYRMGLNLEYADAVRQAGGVPVPMPMIERPDEFDRLLDLCDGLILTGGEDVLPRRYGRQPHPRTEDRKSVV